PSFTRESARPWPDDRTEPGTGRASPGGDQPERGERRTERREDVRDVGAPAQRQPATAGGDRKPHQVCRQWPQQPSRALRREVQRQAKSSDDVVGDHRDGATGNAERRDRSPAEDETRGQRDQYRSARKGDY